MLDLFWQRLFPYQMTRIQEPDLLIDHDSGGGGGGCKRFLGRPIVEPFAYSGIGSSTSHKQTTGAGKYFPFSQPRCGMDSAPSPYSYRTTCPISPSSSPQDNPTIVVHSNNNSLEILDENTRWSSSTSSSVPSKGYFPPCSKNSTSLPPLPPIVLLPHPTSSGEKSVGRNSKVKSKSKNPIKNDNSDKNSCNSSNTSSTSPSKSAASTPCINQCSGSTLPATAPSPCLTSSNHPHPPHPHCGGEDEDNSGQHLLIRYIQCNERPNKKQLVTLGLISLLFLIVLAVLLALFLSPSSTRKLVSTSSSSVRDSSSSDAFISSDITRGLNGDESDLDDSDSYEDGGETSPYYSSTISSSVSPGLDLRKVSKLSWDLLNSNNQDGPSRGSSSSLSGGLSPLGVSSNGEGEIILPAKMIYTSSGDSTDLLPAQPGTGPDGGPQNKKRSCCRTQKYSQVIKREGCEPLTIVNKMCFGQCVSVWVPGLFASFPVCRPSKSTFKTVTLTCGRNGEKRKRVRIEKVRRCSCMEIEPTAASL